MERTPVHEAAQRGESLQLQQLIESGACVNQVTVDSITPLHVASLRGQAQCVQLLLAAGAQVSGPSGQTPETGLGCGKGWDQLKRKRRGLGLAWKEKKSLQETEREWKEEARMGCSGSQGRRGGQSLCQPHTEDQ